MHHARIAQVSALTLAVTAAFAVFPAYGQAYPSKSIRLIVPFPPGSGVDVLTRIVAPHFSERLGQQVVVDNRGGASGIIGAELLVKTPPDGYTIMMATASMLTVSPAMRKLPYSIEKDFTYITQPGATYAISVVHPSMPVKSIKELIALARAKPGVITFASTGIATPPHMGGAVFAVRENLKMVHVPYKGSSPAMTDLLGGHVDTFWVNMQSAMPFVQSKKVRPIVVTSVKRHELVPDVPTMDELGYKDWVAGNTWYGLVGPAGLPREIAERLQAEMVKVLQIPEMKDKLFAAGATIVGNTPKEFTANVQKETQMWVKIIKDTGITAD